MKLTKNNYHQFIKVNPTQKAILDCILSHAYGDKNYSFPSQLTIAKEINVCRHTVMRQLRKIERMMIGNMPLLIRKPRRGNMGKYDHTIYIFPWLNKSNDYTRELQLEIVNELIKKYSDEALEEYENSNHVTNDERKINRQNLLLSISNKIERIKEYANSKANDVLKVLVRVGNTLAEGNIIYSLEKYLLQSLKEIGYEMRTTKAIEELYNMLIGENELYEINLDGYVNNLLSL